MAKRPLEPLASDADIRRATSGGGGAYPLSSTDVSRVLTEVVQPEFVQLVLSDGKVKQLPNRMNYGDNIAFIDWLNFTIHESTLVDCNMERALFTDEDFMIAWSLQLEQFFGFGLTRRMEKGRNFYQQSWMLGDDFGFVCFGGQNSTLLTMLNGTGCMAATKGWESRVSDFLYTKADMPRITRVDLAHDDYTGDTYNVEKCMVDYDAGLYSAGGRHPNIEQRGNWRNPNGKGRTVYIGVRTNGKFLRVYEKGRQLGDENSNWNRIEVELHNVDRVVPFDVLTKPGAYLAATYPAFSFLSRAQCRIDTQQRQVKAGYAHVLKWVKHQCGGALSIVEYVEGSADKAFELLKREPELKGALHIPSPVAMPIHLKERHQPADMALEDD
ncbi:MAG: replication protein [Sideroxydans sp.]|nr:replication protein [Sideroxydans sp.]